MNPTSSTRQSPVYGSSPNSSPSSQREPLGLASSYDQMQWHVEEGCIFPVYSENEIQKFKQTFDRSIKEIAWHLQAMMTCLSENSPTTITTPWKALSTLASFLGNDLPKQIPLSIFTSAVATACIEPITDFPPAKKSKNSESSEAPDPRNKILAATQELVSVISATLNFLQTNLHLNILKEKNPDSYQANRAFKHAMSQMCSVESAVILDNHMLDLAERIISAIAPQGDACSHEAKDQLLRIAINEFVNTQEILIKDVYTNLAQQQKPLPITGKNLLEVCIQHYTGVIRASANIECFPSWEDLSFCYLARLFLQKKNKSFPPQADLQVLLDALTPYFSVSDTISFLKKKQYFRTQLTTNFLRYHAQRLRHPPKGFAKTQPQTVDLNVRYGEFLQCSSLITNFLKGLFILETKMDFSLQNLSAFQTYTQALHLPNTTAAIHNGIEEAASICAEEHQTISNRTKLSLKNTNDILKQFTFHSFALAVTRKQKWKTTTPQEMTFCTWMPEELRVSMLLYNYWKEAHFAHSSNLLFTDNLPKVSQELAQIIRLLATQLEINFHRLCYDLLIDVLEETPLGNSENALERFCTAAHTLQSNTIPKYGSDAQLFKIATNFIATSKPFIMHNEVLDIATRDFEQAQTAFIDYTYHYFLHECHLPATEDAVLAYCQEQCQKNVTIAVCLEKLSFWKKRIALCMTQGVSQVQSQSSFCLDPDASATLVQRHKTLSILETAEIIYDRTTCEFFLQSITSFTSLLQALFKLDTGQNLSIKNLLAFQSYTNALLPNVKNFSTQTMVSEAFAICLEQMAQLEEPLDDIQEDLTNTFIWIQKLLETTLTLFVFRKKVYKNLSPQEAVTQAFQMICPDAYASYKLLLSTESNAFWKKIIQTPPKKKRLLQISNFLNRTENLMKAIASELTQCSLSFCQKVLMKISREISLTPTIEQICQTEEQFIAIAYRIYPKIILENEHNQSTFKDLVSFLAKDKTHTNYVRILTLAIESVLKAQADFLEITYGYLIQHKLPVPLTGGDLLTFCKQKYASSTHVPSSLATLPSWNNAIFCSIARIFLLSMKLPILPKEFEPWDPQALITKMSSFFPETNNELEILPENIKIEVLSNLLAKKLNCCESLDSHDTIPQPPIDLYTCKAYEHFLQSAVLLKGIFRMLFKQETGNEYSQQNEQNFHIYINKLLINEPENRRTSALQDVAMICSEEIQILEQSEQSHLVQLWEDLNCANSLLQNFMECSLALILLCATTDLELTAQETVDIALQITSCIKSLPTTLNALLTRCISSSAGANALQEAMHAFSSGNLCLGLFEESPFSSQETKINSLQTAIDAHVAGHSCPQIAECSELLSSVILSEQENLENLCQKLYTNLKENITASISKEPSEETPSQKFTETANICHAAMMAENHAAEPLFQVFVSILAEKHESEKKTQAEISTTQEEEPEELPDNIWQEIEAALLEERLEDLLGADSQLTPTQRTEPDKSPTELCPEAEDILSADDFTDFFGETEPFEQESKITTTQVTEEGEDSLTTLWPNIEQILSSEDFTDLLENPENFVGLATQEDSQDTEKESSS